MADLYVSIDLRDVEVGSNERVRGDLIQTDPDGLRIYRKLDGLWWRWLFATYRGHGALKPLRSKLVSIHGEESVAKAEAKAPAPDYRTPVIP
jgi:hypothetical protein